MASSRVTTTLVAIVAISVFGAALADDWKTCSGTFCERWMCEQNNNRKCNLAQEIDPSLNPSTCVQAKGTDAFETALAVCNAQQTTNSLSASCTLADGTSVTIGIYYQPDTCAPVTGDEDYVPSQLVATGNQAVYVESLTLDALNQDAGAVTAARASTATCAEIATPLYLLFNVPGISTQAQAATAAQAFCASL